MEKKGAQARDHNINSQVNPAAFLERLLTNVHAPQKAERKLRNLANFFIFFHPL
jgi:hypothetical protein